MRRRLLSSILCTALFAAGPAFADKRASAEEATRAESERAADAASAKEVAAPPPGGESKKVRLPDFVPPNRGRPKGTVGGGTRSMGAADPARVGALAPSEIALTLEGQPKLYWYLSADSRDGARLAIVPDGAESTPILRATIAGPLRAGVQRIALADYGIRLEPGVTYLWTVALAPDPSRTWDAMMIGGAIQRTQPAADLRSDLASADAAETFFILAKAGIWYDALDAISTQIAASPDASEPRQQRASLLEQAGLGRLVPTE
jgi:hypothetical protein